MQKHLMPGLIAMGAILTAGLAVAQSDITSPALSTTESTASLPRLGADGKPIQTEAERVEMEKRVFGVLPNYRTADGTKAFLPLTAPGKITIAAKDSFDRPSFVIAAFWSMVGQADNQNPGFGQGVEGYAHRYAASVSDQIIGNMMTEGFMPALLREDPRYFRKVNGPLMSRLGYSLTRTLIAKDDHGKNCFNFAEVIGNGIAGTIGVAYYPENRRGIDILGRTANAMLTDTLSNVLKEFWPDIKNHYRQRHLAKLAATQ
jgi:hypothetical protein